MIGIVYLGAWLGLLKHRGQGVLLTFTVIPFAWCWGLFLICMLFHPERSYLASGRKHSTLGLVYSILIKYLFALVLPIWFLLPAVVVITSFCE